MKTDELLKSGDMTRVTMIPNKRQLYRVRDRSQMNGKEEYGYMDEVMGYITLVSQHCKCTDIMFTFDCIVWFSVLAEVLWLRPQSAEVGKTP